MDVHVTKGIAQLDPSLKDMILNPKMKKICRPPNAFMVFAREHRKDLAKEHPEISNKFISSMLGKMWKETSNVVKTEYFKKAHLLSELHKARYPDYVYSPREARIQKLKKIKKRDPKKGVESATDPKYPTTQHSEERNSSQDEEWTIDTSNEGKSSSPEYVPNNPEYFTQKRPESRNGERWGMDQTYPNQYADEFEYYRGQRDVPESMDRIVHPENDYWWYTRPRRYGYCNPARIESRSRCIPPCESHRGQEAVPYLPEHYSLGTSSSLCSPTRPFARPLSPFYYRSPCTSPIPRSYQPYWRPPPYYRDDEDYICEENIKPYSFPTSCHAPSSDYFPRSFAYVDKPYGKMNRSPTSYFGYQGQDWDSSRNIVQDETLNVTPVSPPLLRRSEEMESNLSNPYCDAGNEENMLLRSSRIVVSETKKQVFPCFSELDSRQHEATSSSTYIAASDELNLLNTLENHPRKTQSYPCVSSADKSMKGTPFGGYFPADHHLSSLRNHIRGHIVHPYSSKMARQLERASSSRLPYCPQSVYRSNSALDPYIRNMDTADYYRACDPKFYNESRFHTFGPEGRPRKLSKMKCTEIVGNDSREVYDNPAEKLDDRTVWSFTTGSLSHDNINDHLEGTDRESNKLDSMDRNDETGGEFEEDEDINVVNIDYIGAHVEIAGDNELVPSTSELEAQKSVGKIESIDHRMTTNLYQHGPAAETGGHILSPMTTITGYGGETMYEHENAVNSSHQKSEVQYENTLPIPSGEDNTEYLNITMENQCKKPGALCSNLVLKSESKSISPAKVVTHSDRISVDQNCSKDRCYEASVTLERLPGFSTFEAKARQNIYFMNNITENEKSADDRLDILSMPSLVKRENV